MVLSHAAASVISALAPDLIKTGKNAINDYLDGYGTRDIAYRAIRNLVRGGGESTESLVSRIQKAAIDSGGRVVTAMGGVAPSGATPMESLGQYQPGLGTVPAPGYNLAERTGVFSTQTKTQANNKMPMIFSNSSYNKRNTRRTRGLNRIPMHGPSVSVLSSGTAGGFPQQRTIFQSGGRGGETEGRVMAKARVKGRVTKGTYERVKGKPSIYL